MLSISLMKYMSSKQQKCISTASAVIFCHNILTEEDITPEILPTLKRNHLEAILIVLCQFLSKKSVEDLRKIKIKSCLLQSLYRSPEEESVMQYLLFYLRLRPIFPLDIVLESRLEKARCRKGDRSNQPSNRAPAGKHLIFVLPLKFDNRQNFFEII